MLSPARYIADFARFAVQRPAQERQDRAALAELERRELPWPPGLDVRWLGVSGYRLECEGQVLVVDPYLSRVPLRAVLQRAPALPDPALIDRYIGAESALVGVLVGHTHFDHAVDAPAIAARFGAPAYGSASLVRLMALHGVGHLAVEAEPHRRYALGPFTVSFVPSLHAKLLLGFGVPFDGELTCEHLDALSPGAYRCGAVYGIRIEVAGTVLYHQGSANLLDDEIRQGADVFLAGVAGRGFTPDYWRRVLGRLRPHTVVPTHYDDFFRPLDAPLGFTTNVNLARVPDEIGAVSREVSVAALPVAGGAG